MWIEIGDWESAIIYSSSLIFKHNLVHFVDEATGDRRSSSQPAVEREKEVINFNFVSSVTNCNLTVYTMQHEGRN